MSECLSNIQPKINFTVVENAQCIVVIADRIQLPHVSFTCKETPKNMIMKMSRQRVSIGKFCLYVLSLPFLCDYLVCFHFTEQVEEPDTSTEDPIIHCMFKIGQTNSLKYPLKYAIINTIVMRSGIRMCQRPTILDFGHVPRPPSLVTFFYWLVTPHPYPTLV